MQRKNQRILIASLLVACSVFIVYYGKNFFQSVVYGEDSFLTGTNVAGIELDGKSYTEARSLIESSLQKWQNEQQITLLYEGKEEKVSSDVFRIDLDKTMEQLIIEQPTSLDIHIQVGHAMLRRHVTEIADRTLQEHLDITSLNEAIIQRARKLQSGKYVIDLNDYVRVEAGKEQVVSTSSLEVPKRFRDVVSHWVDEFGDIRLEKNETFSFLQGPMAKGDMYSDEEWSFISTTLFQVVMPTNFYIQERHIGRTLPSYTTLGSEAKVVTNKLDFAFGHNNKATYRVVSTYEQGRLTMDVIGVPFIYTYKTLLANKVTYEPQVESIVAPHLSEGKRRVKQQGRDGISGVVMRQKVSPSGVVGEEVLFEDFYPPTKTVMEVGMSEPKQVETNNENEKIKEVTEDSLYREESEEREEKQEKQGEIQSNQQGK
ncbi:VanW family protein [Priestia taiwanensis]|uniref:G5 domain-containing protein n=1 Tax=Priestia taiwanensis TaxID=1347902 RepID=A0A917AU79_9BACI|nr:VanW family protein [Priestia taiwanensis]MBM7363592.1 hypothetical protein [Priestia taiwanensis]GGE75795.1 hypothetical protein GCM10007140_26970 [Priestia taiwanensis]